MSDVVTVVMVAGLYWVLILIGGSYLMIGIEGTRKAFDEGTEWWLRLLMLWGGLMWVAAGVLFLVAPTATHGAPGFIGTVIGAGLAHNFANDKPKSPDQT